MKAERAAQIAELHPPVIGVNWANAKFEDYLAEMLREHAIELGLCEDCLAKFTDPLAGANTPINAETESA